MSDEQIQCLNTQLALQNHFYYIGKSVQKESRYKLGFTLKITNRLIHTLSEY